MSDKVESMAAALEPCPDCGSPRHKSCKPIRSCNRHSNCEEAERIWLDRNPRERWVPLSFHCHNDECEDCFGC